MLSFSFFKIHGFSAVLRIELEAELDILDIRDEYLLSKMPMQMDVLIVKKENKRQIKKNIGRIFRKHNIIEYKAAMDLIVRANLEKVKEEKKMCDALRELFAEELKESEENGIKLTKTIFKLSASGTSIEDIARQCGISEKRVEEILE